MKYRNQERSTTFNTRAQAGVRNAALPALLCAGIALSACTSLGTGSGSVSPGGAPVTFAWKSTNGGTSGTMSAALAGGQTFLGPYLQITKEVRNEDFSPLWPGWSYGWNDWSGWGPFGGGFEPAFVTEYSGRVMANLQSTDGQRMRCRFNLTTPPDGMTGGGQGECQLGSGRSVNAVFPPGSTKLGKG
jgi:hypothetical protein